MDLLHGSHCMYLKKGTHFNYIKIKNNWVGIFGKLKIMNAISIVLSNLFII